MHTEQNHVILSEAIVKIIFLCKAHTEKIIAKNDAHL